MMSRTALALAYLATAAGMLAGPFPAVAQEARTLGAIAGAIKTEGNANLIEPASLDALKAMGAHVAGLTNFELISTFETDLMLEGDQTIQIGGTGHYLARRPDRLRVELAADTGRRAFIYDGSSLFVVSPDDQVYGRLDDVGPTIRQMLASVDYHAEIELPLADLFALGTEDAVDRIVVEGFLVGPAIVNGKSTTHWAYRSEAKDFQIWIEDGDAPLPARVVIDDNTQEGKPRFEATLTWVTDADPDPSQFVFTPPAGSTEITFMLRDPAADNPQAVSGEVRP